MSAIAPFHRCTADETYLCHQLKPSAPFGLSFLSLNSNMQKRNVRRIADRTEVTGVVFRTESFCSIVSTEAFSGRLNGGQNGQR